MLPGVGSEPDNPVVTVAGVYPETFASGYIFVLHYAKGSLPPNLFPTVKRESSLSLALLTSLEAPWMPPLPLARAPSLCQSPAWVRPRSSISRSPIVLLPSTTLRPRFPEAAAVLVVAGICVEGCTFSRRLPSRPAKSWTRRSFPTSSIGSPGTPPEKTNYRLSVEQLFLDASLVFKSIIVSWST